MADLKEHIFDLIYQERMRQDNIWGWPRQLSDLLWYCILGEEVGEVARAILEDDRENLKEELVQVAAVCVAHLETIYGDKWMVE